jgi:hypothetical protein
VGPSGLGARPAVAQAVIDLDEYLLHFTGAGVQRYIAPLLAPQFAALAG